MKKGLSTILVVTLLMFSISIFKVNNSKAATTDAVLSFDQTAISAVAGGSNFNLVARIDPGSNTVEGINAVQLDITFAPAVVHIVSVTAASPFSIMIAPDIAAANTSGSLSIPLFIPASQITTVSDIATLVFAPQTSGADSPIAFAATADAAVNDGSGTYVVGTRTGATVTVTADPSSDTTPAVISDGSPSSSLAVGTSQATIGVTTDEAATCRYSTVSGVDYDSMTNTFSTTGSTTHSFVASGLIDGGSYGYFVRCHDANDNNNLIDYLISFSVATPSTKKGDNDNRGGGDNDSRKKKDTTPRRIKNSKKVVSRGMILREWGKRFSKRSMVDLYFEKPGGGYFPPMQIKTSSKGSFVIRYRVNKPKGRYGWYAVDTKTGKKSKSAYFRVR